MAPEARKEHKLIGRPRTAASKKSAVFTREVGNSQSPVPASVNGGLRPSKGQAGGQVSDTGSCATALKHERLVCAARHAMWEGDRERASLRGRTGEQ